jgi:hypothetical protein
MISKESCPSRPPKHLPTGLRRLIYMSRALIKQTLQLLRNSGCKMHRFVVIETLDLI